MLSYSVGKITEVLVAEHSNKLVMELLIDDLEKLFGEPRPDVTHGFPLPTPSCCFDMRLENLWPMI